MRKLSLPGVALAITASCSSSAPEPRTTKTQPSNELTAVSLGVTIRSKDDTGAPRLVQAVVPRNTLKAGLSPEQAAREHLGALKSLWFQKERASDLLAAGTQRLRNGAHVVKLQQRIDNIDIHQGEVHVLVHADNALAAISGTVRPAKVRPTFKSDPVTAVQRALDTVYGKGRTRPAITDVGESGGFRKLTVASTTDFSVQSARAKKELMPEGDKLTEIWSVELLAESLSKDNTPETSARRVLLADADGRVIRDVNLLHKDAFLYRAFADTTGDRRPFDGATRSWNPHPTGNPDGSVPGFATHNLVAMDSFNGPRDSWLAPNATTTSGNNVDAFADITPPGAVFNEGDIRPAVRAGRTLNYHYDTSLEPLANATQSMASAVNVFYMNNWLHDWYYDSGFTEATGNAQVSNYGRGGVEGDPIIARAQANALGGSRDNATMFTPSDGESPIMSMFLFSGRTNAMLTSPAGSANTAWFVNGPRAFNFTGQAVLTVDQTGGTHKACGPVGPEVAGKIAVFDWDGTCPSVTAVNNVKAAGAVGAIAVLPDDALGTLNGSAAANIPGLVVGQTVGAALKAALPATVTLARSTHVEHDGSLDNAIVAHEWGHYLHHRLASCEAQQCASMSEGWGDFNALHMMLRTADDRDGTFAAGSYALFAGGLDGFVDDPGFFGIRRVAYSTNRTKNSLSFRHIANAEPLPTDMPINPGPVPNGNAEVHNAGEIWATMLWEAYNVLIDEHSRAEARRRMSDYVVAGLMLTPPDATFLEGRDAILAAAGALDTEDMLLMAAAFAGRGAGSCAIAPAANSPDNAGLVESGTIAARVETSNVTLSDDGRSCDNDGYLDPGESGTLHITVANSGVLAAEGVVVRATTSTPGVTVGPRIRVGKINALTHVDLAIPVSLSASAPTNSDLNINIRITSDAGCDTDDLVVALHQRMGVDEAEAVSTSDDLETNIVAWTPTGEGAADLWSRQEAASGNHSLFGANAGFTSDTQLVSPVLQVGTDPLVVTFKHAFNLEAIDIFGLFFDGGVIEVSNDGGATWRDVTEVMVDPGYPATISVDFDNPLAGRDAYSGTNTSYPAVDPVSLNFGTQFSGQAVQLRFRIGTDFCCTGVGWNIDDIAVSGITNTPFPGFVAEPSTCSGAAARATVEGITNVRDRRNSLDSTPVVEQPEEP